MWIWSSLREQMENLISSDPEILGGKPVIKGTRISVEFLLKLIKAQMPFDEILDEYPSLSKDTLEKFLKLASLFQQELNDVDLARYLHAGSINQ